jgi:hypothetical protein
VPPTTHLPPHSTTDGRNTTNSDTPAQKSLNEPLKARKTSTPSNRTAGCPLIAETAKVGA